MPEASQPSREWNDLKKNISHKPAREQVDAIAQFVESRAETRQNVDNLVSSTPEIRQLFLNRLREKVTGADFVFSDSDVRILTLFGFSATDRQKFIAYAAQSYAKPSLAQTFDTVNRMNRGQKKYAEQSTGLATDKDVAEKNADNAVGAVHTASGEVGRTESALKTITQTIATKTESQTTKAAELGSLQKEKGAIEKTDLPNLRSALAAEQDEEKKRTIQSEINTKQGRLEKLPSEISPIQVALGQIAGEIKGLNKEKTRLETVLQEQQWVLSARSSDAEQTENRLQNIKQRYTVSIEDMQSLALLQKKMKSYRMQRVQQLYADIIQTLPPVTESADYSKGTGFVLLRMYTILVSSLSEKRKHPEVVAATHELQLHFGLESTGKINGALLDALESFVTGQQIAYANTLHIDA